MSEIEEFEKWLANSGVSYRRDVALGSWQACAELKDERINELEAELVEQAKVLVANVTKQLELEAENAALRAKFAELEEARACAL